MLLYPLKTVAIYKEMPWGGSGLNDKYNKKSPYQLTGESWEASDHPNGSTLIENGAYAGESLNGLSKRFSKAFLGYAGEQFPVLFKLIDAKERLSVQVHPDNVQAAAFGDNGKTEMWIVLKAEAGAGVFLGFKEPLTTEEFKKRIIDERLEDALHFVRANPGDTFFLPAGLVHAVGAGLVLAEIQQSSDATFRVYDWSRLGIDGKARKLHIEEALLVSDTSMRGEKEAGVINTPPDALNARVEYLPACPYFAAARIYAKGKLSQHTHGLSFHIVFIEEGSATVKAENSSVTAGKGETIILPAAVNTYQLEGEFSALVFWKPQSEKEYREKLSDTGVEKRDIDRLFKA